jgi:hypothetical protein
METPTEPNGAVHRRREVARRRRRGRRRSTTTVHVGVPRVVAVTVGKLDDYGLLAAFRGGSVEHGNGVLSLGALIKAYEPDALGQT